MRTSRALLTLAAALSLVAGVAPAAAAQAAAARPAAQTVFTVHDYSRSEATRDCTKTAPYTCGLVSANSLIFMIAVANRPQPAAAITVTYQLVSGTAVAGQDFTGTTGTATIPANGTQALPSVPLVNDGVAEPSETVTVRLTGASVPGSLTDTGTMTIEDGDQFPADCTLSAGAPSGTPERSLTCTARPAGQRWFIVQSWASMAGREVEYGNGVVGNGTSTVYVFLPTAFAPAFQAF